MDRCSCLWQRVLDRPVRVYVAAEEQDEECQRHDAAHLAATNLRTLGLMPVATRPQTFAATGRNQTQGGFLRLGRTDDLGAETSAALVYSDCRLNNGVCLDFRCVAQTGPIVVLLHNILHRPQFRCPWSTRPTRSLSMDTCRL